MTKSRFKMVHLNARARPYYTMTVCVPVGATDDEIQEEIECIEANSKPSDWKVSHPVDDEWNEYCSIEVEMFGIEEIPTDSRAADTGFIEHLHQPRFKKGSADV